MYLNIVGKCCCALFFVLLTWSRGTSIGEYSTVASVSSRTGIVYIQGRLFELAVPRATMTEPSGSSAAAAPVTLNSPAADHVTAVDRAPERRVSGAIYALQRLLELRRQTTERLSDGFLARLKQLGIAKGCRHRGVRGGRKSHRPIPVCLTTRSLTKRVGGGCHRDWSEGGRRCLVCPQRLSLRQTESVMRDAAVQASTTTRNAFNITIEY